MDLILQTDIFNLPHGCKLILQFKLGIQELQTLLLLFNQPSTLIIIAISPKYKEVVEGAKMDAHSLHTRYIYTTDSLHLHYQLVRCDCLL